MSNRHVDTPLTPAFVVLALTLAFISLRLSLFARDLPQHLRTDAISLFIVATRGNADPNRTPPGLIVLPGNGDYDGEYFYRLGLNPFTTKQDAYGLSLDKPAYRQQRLVYPLMAWALSGGGDPRWLPWVMLGLNVAALCGVAALAGTYSKLVGASALWGVVPALYPGFALSLALDTAEPIDMCLLLGALLLARLRRYVPAAGCLSLAVLTRETSVFVAAAALLVWLWNRQGRVGRTRVEIPAPPLIFFVTPLAVYVLWHLTLLRLWGPEGMRLHNLSLPFAGLAYFVRGFARDWTPLHQFWLFEILFLVTIGIATLYALRSSGADPFLKVSWFIFAALSIVLSRSVWHGDTAYMRVLFEFSVLGFLILLESSLHIRVPIFIISVVLWFMVAVHLLAAGIPLRHSVFETRRNVSAAQSVV